MEKNLASDARRKATAPRDLGAPAESYRILPYTLVPWTGHHAHQQGCRGEDGGTERIPGLPFLSCSLPILGSRWVVLRDVYTLRSQVKVQLAAVEWGVVVVLLNASREHTSGFNKGGSLCVTARNSHCQWGSGQADPEGMRTRCGTGALVG